MPHLHSCSHFTASSSKGVSGCGTSLASAMCASNGMANLPDLNLVVGGKDEENTRLRKRVRTLETNLGYSNLTAKVSSNGPVVDRNFWDDDADDFSRVHRKRRLPGGGPETYPYSPLRRGYTKNRSIPVLSGTLLSSEGPVRGTTSSAKLAESCENSQLRTPLMRIGNIRASERLSDPTCPDVTGGQPMHESMKDCWRLDVDHVLRCAEESARGGTSLHTRCMKDTSTELYGVTALEGVYDGGVQSNPDLRVSHKTSVKTGYDGSSSKLNTEMKNGLKRKKDTVEVASGQEPGLAMVGSTSSRPKLRALRSGSCRSLLSPKNPLTSNTVVARVKQDLQNGDEKRPKVLLVGSGTFNPVHKLHIRRFYLARHFLEARHGVRVVGGIVSPSHPTLVRQRHRVRAAEIIPPKHRLSMARAAVGEDRWLPFQSLLPTMRPTVIVGLQGWLAVDPWEVTRKRIMDYMSVLEHAKEVCHETFPGHAGDITILYMCQASQIHHLNPALLKEGGFGLITVCRPLEKVRLLKELSPSFRKVAIVVEDSAILSAELEKTSSTMVRYLLKQGRSVEGMVGRAVARYIRDNNIAQRVSGKHKWTVEDNAFMFDREDREDRPYHNLPRICMRRASQMPLQH